MRSFFFVCVTLAVGACSDDKPRVGDTVQVDAQTDATTAETQADAVEDGDATAPQDTDASEPQDTVDATDTSVAPDTLADTTDTSVAPDTIADTSVADTSDVSEVATTCEAEGECQNCAFATKVTSADDCYCLFCATFPMTKSECSDNQASWNQFCNPWPRPENCPVALCLPVTPPLCEKNQCVKNPNGCNFPDDCGACRFTEPPVTAADCHCPMCSSPLSVDYCAVIEAAVSEVCADFDYDACLLPPCMRPPPIICSQESGTCGYGDFEFSE